MMDEIAFTWEAQDGYCGGARPQHLTVCVEDFEGMDREQIEQALVEIINEDFSSTVTWVADTNSITDKIEAALAAHADT